MADQTQGVPATKLAGLERFAGEVFANSQGKYTLDDYNYFDDTSLFSSAAFTVAANGLAVQDFSIFQTPYGQRGQGYPAPLNLTLADTNLQKGQANGKFPSNQSYVGVAGGFSIYCIPMGVDGVTLQSTGGIPIPDASDAWQIAQSITWTWNVGGNQSPTLNYEPILAWPSGFGIFGIGAAGSTQAVSNGGPVSQMRKFAFPLMFPPEVSADLNLAVRKPVSNLVSLNNGSLVIVAMHQRGYMLSKVR